MKQILSLFLTFLKIGTFTFGGGYAMIPAIRRETVERHAWIGESDMAEAVKTAVINKRAGGMGLILGRKAFQRPMNEGVEIIRSVQDVYLEEQVTIA